MLFSVKGSAGSYRYALKKECFGLLVLVLSYSVNPFSIEALHRSQFTAPWDRDPDASRAHAELNPEPARIAMTANCRDRCVKHSALLISAASIST